MGTVTMLTDAWRSVGYIYNTHYTSYLCDYHSPQPMHADHNLQMARWYQFSGAAGTSRIRRDFRVRAWGAAATTRRPHTGTGYAGRDGGRAPLDETVQLRAAARARATMHTAILSLQSVLVKCTKLVHVDMQTNCIGDESGKYLLAAIEQRKKLGSPLETFKVDSTLSFEVFKELWHPKAGGKKKKKKGKKKSKKRK